MMTTLHKIRTADARVVRTPRRKTSRAFTLVELLVVMGVIVLIVAAAVPAINALSGSKSTQACQNTISAMLGTARRRRWGCSRIRA